MPVTVVLDHPRWHYIRRLWRTLGAAAGALLLVVGLSASIAAVPSSLAVASFAVGWVATDDTDPDPWPPDDLRLREIVLAWAVSTPWRSWASGAGFGFFVGIARSCCSCAASGTTRRRAR